MFKKCTKSTTPAIFNYNIIIRFTNTVFNSKIIVLKTVSKNSDTPMFLYDISLFFYFFVLYYIAILTVYAWTNF